MKTIFAALASAALLAAPMASISTPAAAQTHGGGFHGGGGGGFHGGGGGGFRGGGGGGFRGGGGARGAGFGGGGFHDGGHDRGGHGRGRDRDDGFFFFGAPYGDPFYYGDDFYGYDGLYGYDGGYDTSPSCGSWSWDAADGRYVWVPC